MYGTITIGPPNHVNDGCGAYMRAPVELRDSRRVRLKFFVRDWDLCLVEVIKNIPFRETQRIALWNRQPFNFLCSARYSREESQCATRSFKRHMFPQNSPDDDRDWSMTTLPPVCIVFVSPSWNAPITGTLDDCRLSKTGWNRTISTTYRCEAKRTINNLPPTIPTSKW